MIRPANFADIPSIVMLLQEAYTKTHYARTGSAGIDVTEAKRLLVASIQRHGQNHGGACYVAVADCGAAITGLILGTLVRCYSIGDKLMATDLFWVSSPHGDPRDALGLMRGMIAWARGCPAVVEIQCGTTAVMGDDPSAAGKMLERLGMSNFGNIYRMEAHQ